ncbi:hypothetical protein ACF0H5_004848 [Mactra antiquata]
MLFQIGSTVTLGVVIYYILYIRDWLDLDKGPILTNKPGKCQVIQEAGGSEDIVDIGDGVFLISTGFGFGSFKSGEIVSLDVKDDNKLVTMNLTNIPQNVDEFLASPHGMSLWKDPSTGDLYLYVITHPSKEDRIEVFIVENAHQLRHIKTITDPSFTYMNDLVMVGLDKFYTTRYLTLSRTEYWYIFFEHICQQKWGKIFYYDGRKAREVSSGHYMGNGINSSPDKSMIYVAEWGGHVLKAFYRQGSNDLVPAWEKHIDTGLDNIYVDKNGDLWIGGVDRIWTVVNPFSKTTPPSQVLRVKIRDQAVADVEEIYTDDGQECSLATTGAYAYGKLVIGTVSSQTVVCDVNFLSP